MILKQTHSLKDQCLNSKAQKCFNGNQHLKYINENKDKQIKMMLKSVSYPHKNLIFLRNIHLTEDRGHNTTHLFSQQIQDSHHTSNKIRGQQNQLIFYLK